jgi:hypothetical protein
MQKRKLQVLTQIREGQLQNLSVYNHAEIKGDVGKHCLLRDAFDKGENVSESVARLFEDLQLLEDAYADGLIRCRPSPPRYDHLHRITDINNIRLTLAGEGILEPSTNPESEKWSWLRHQYNDIKGHAKWELIKWVVGAPVVAAWFIALLRFIQHAPWWQVCGFVFVPLIVLGCVFAIWLFATTKAHHRLETASPEKSAIPPLGIYSTLTVEPIGPTLDRKTFEVLKWFSILPRNGSAPVSYVAQVHGLESIAGPMKASAWAYAC